MIHGLRSQFTRLLVVLHLSNQANFYSINEFVCQKIQPILEESQNRSSSQSKWSILKVCEKSGSNGFRYRNVRLLHELSGELVRLAANSSEISSDVC